MLSDYYFSKVKKQSKARVRSIQIVNKFIDEHLDELYKIWNKAQRGEKIEKINR